MEKDVQVWVPAAAPCGPTCGNPCGNPCGNACGNAGCCDTGCARPACSTSWALQKKNKGCGDTCAAPATTCCDPCASGGRGKLFGGLCKKKHDDCGCARRLPVRRLAAATETVT